MKVKGGGAEVVWGEGGSRVSGFVVVGVFNVYWGGGGGGVARNSHSALTSNHLLISQ